MVKQVNGDILEFSENLLIHQVNCKGIMGAGLAKTIKNRYPEVFDDYKDAISLYNFNEDELLGSYTMTALVKDKFIVNLFGQNEFGNDRRYTSYSALVIGLFAIFKRAKKYNYSIAIPYRMGCARGGGNWTYVYSYICMLSEEFGVDVTIYKYI